MFNLESLDEATVHGHGGTTRIRWHIECYNTCCMQVKLISNHTGRSTEMRDRLFGRLLQLAQFNHWRPEKISNPWPSGSWNTEIILRHAYPYLPGSVSDEDAHHLASALRQCLTTQSAGMQEDLYLKAIILLEFAKQGGFEVQILADDSPAPTLLSSTTSSHR